MALTALDRLLTIVVTATLTSAVWIVAGGTDLERVNALATQGGQATGTKPASPKARATGAAAGDAARVPAQPVSGDLVIPVEGIRGRDLADTFTQARGGGTRLHEALDIMAPRGTPVVAAAAGTVEKLFLSKPGGKTIYIRSPDKGTIHYYAHLDQYAPGLAEGQSVRTGQRLGTVGSTGNADPAGPHLHFAILRTAPQAKWWEPSTPVNPYPLLRGR
jgi:peptidoglycan LD-endopeptidase LytH